MELLLSKLSDYRQDQNGVNVLNTWSFLIPSKSPEVYERHSCSIDLFLLLPHFHFTSQTVLCKLCSHFTCQLYYCCIVCNMFVNRVMLACFVFICYLCNVGFKSSSELMLIHVLTLNKTFCLFHYSQIHTIQPRFVSFSIIHPSTTIFIHWNIYKNKQEVVALKLKQHFNNDRQRKYLKVVCKKCARTETKFQISWTNTSPRLLFPSSFVQFFYLGLNLFSGAYWRGNRKSIYSRNLIKLHNQNSKMCFCENYGGAQPFTFSYKYEDIKTKK